MVLLINNAIASIARFILFLTLLLLDPLP